MDKSRVQHRIELYLKHNQAEYEVKWVNLTVLYTLNVSGWVAVLKETLY
jgi:hypothetical protein